MYRVTTVNVSRKWIEWAEWAASLCTANSPFPGQVYCSHPVLFVGKITVNAIQCEQLILSGVLLSHGLDLSAVVQRGCSFPV